MAVAVTSNNNLEDVIVAQALERAGLADWMPEGEGKWSLPIQFLPDDAGWVELMRHLNESKKDFKWKIVRHKSRCFPLPLLNNFFDAATILLSHLLQYFALRC